MRTPLPFNQDYSSDLEQTYTPLWLYQAEEFHFMLLSWLWTDQEISLAQINSAILTVKSIEHGLDVDGHLLSSIQKQKALFLAAFTIDLLSGVCYSNDKNKNHSKLK